MRAGQTRPWFSKWALVSDLTEIRSAQITLFERAATLSSLCIISRNALGFGASDRGDPLNQRAGKTNSGYLQRTRPILLLDSRQGLGYMHVPKYRKESLRPDLIAGLTAAATVIPKAMLRHHCRVARAVGLYTAFVVHPTAPRRRF
jgi:hypothetical protein